jgi:Ser/Thr protein kinase RdoA (MazF antagonist)
LHLELSAMADVRQRPAWQSANEVARSIEAHRLRPSAIASMIVLHLERVRERLNAAGASSFPVTIVHGDFISQNLLFQDDKVSGVLDFDSVHLDLRAADVACARRSTHDEVVRSY